MKNLIRPCFVLFGLLTLLTGFLYPAIITVAGQAVFHDQANGSVISHNGKAIGSNLIGQSFDAPEYFWGRPSATGPNAYNAAASTGSNLGPTNTALLEAIKVRAESLHAAHPDQKGPIPVDLVTASGSGLDPHISPAAAEYQVSRVAKARGISEEFVRTLVLKSTASRDLGVLGEPRVNVLQLNLSLDAEGANTR